MMLSSTIKATVITDLFLINTVVNRFSIFTYICLVVYKVLDVFEFRISLIWGCGDAS
jgi:hypothetical protein